MATNRVLVITGAGGMGLAIAQRLGSGRVILLADFSKDILETASTQLKLRGHTNVHLHVTDVSNLDSVGELAAAAAALGSVETVVHTAGISPSNTPSNDQAARIYNTNLIGTALVIDAFQPIIAPGGSMVCIASLAGHMLPTIPTEEAIHFGLCPAGPGLLKSSLIKLDTDHGGQAYMMSKAANLLRVKVSAHAFGLRGTRINSISPGIVATPMGHAELAGVGGDHIRGMIDGQPVKRIGTVDDITEAVAFLVGPGASWITGSDLPIDGGAFAEHTRQAFLAGQNRDQPQQGGLVETWTGSTTQE